MLAVGCNGAPGGAQDDGARKEVLKLGWGQDVQTLNPFVGAGRGELPVWAMNWDLLVNFSPDDLSPAPGIAESWDVSKDKKTVTFHLITGAKWSDGQPITSKDVKWSLDVLGTNGLIFTRLHRATSPRSRPRTTNTVVVHTDQPDARIVGGLFVYIMPEHI